jgi:hypothetical protein
MPVVLQEPCQFEETADFRQSAIATALNAPKKCRGLGIFPDQWRVFRQ